jgi:AFG3 family protein
MRRASWSRLVQVQGPRRLSSGPGGAKAPPAGGPAAREPPKGKYAGYHVKGSGKSQSASDGRGSSIPPPGGPNSGWDKLLPYVFGGGVAVSYLWFAGRGAGTNSGDGSRVDPDTITGNGGDRGMGGTDGSPPFREGNTNLGGTLGDAPAYGREVSWMTLKNEVLPTRRVAKIEVVNGSNANVYFRDDTSRPRFRFNIGSVETFERNLEQAQEDMGIQPRNFIPVIYSEETALSRVLVEWLPTALFVAAYAFVARRMGGAGGLPGAGGGRFPGSGAGPNRSGPGVSKGSGQSPRSGGMGPFGGGMGPGGGASGPGGIFNVGKANATVLNRDSNKVDVTFKDVAGLNEAKEEIMEFVQYLKKPEKYKELGAKIPKGALMYGPPGTGKTLLAKATAGEAGVPFLTMSGSDFMEMFVGVGPSRVRDLFAQARSMTPCIVFIDEIDAIGRKRGRGGFMGGNDERENTLNQLLVEMDGFASNSGVVVLAGTNRADVLDAALLRPGRFDRQIVIDPPDIAGRRDIFNVHLSGITINDPPGKDEVAKAMAARTPGFAGADIANVCNEAALLAARRGKESVELDDFESAVDRVIGGLEKNNLVMSPEEKRTVAFHEAGHAVAGWFLKHAMPLLKVSIIPRGTAALGYAQYQPTERYLFSKESLLDQMCMTLAGRAAEEMFFESVTTGASDDFNKVTRIAYQSVAEWGMGDTIGNLAFSSQNREGEESFYKPYSDRTALGIDEEVREMVAAAYERTKKLLVERREDVTKVANLLLEREAIGHADMIRLLGERPSGSDRSTFDEILEDAGQSDRGSIFQAPDGKSGKYGQSQQKKVGEESEEKPSS